MAVHSLALALVADKQLAVQFIMLLVNWTSHVRQLLPAWSQDRAVPIGVAAEVCHSGLNLRWLQLQSHACSSCLHAVMLTASFQHTCRTSKIRTSCHGALVQLSGRDAMQGLTPDLYAFFLVAGVSCRNVVSWLHRSYLTDARLCLQAKNANRLGWLAESTAHIPPTGTADMVRTASMTAAPLMVVLHVTGMAAVEQSCPMNSAGACPEA